MLGPQSDVVNGQLFSMPTTAQYAPSSYGRQTTGVPNVSPTMPPFMANGNTSGASLGYEGVNGHGTAGNNALVTSIAHEHPHSLKVSPVWWAVAALLIGLALLNGTAFRKTIDEHVAGGAKLGDAGASGSESASV